MKTTVLSVWFCLSVAVFAASAAQAATQAATRQGVDMSHLTTDSTINDLLTHPAFAGFGHHLLTRDGDVSRRDLPLSRVGSLLPYHGHVSPIVAVAALNHMVDDAAAGRTIFYSFYAETQRQADPAKSSTGLFFFRGQPGAPFAVICPGGGFSYVGSFHEGFPYAMELSKKGYNAFVLRYRVGGGGNPAARDLAAALSSIFANADELQLDTRGYSLWGSSAGARMVAYLGSHGSEAFGGDALPRPGAIIMAYTGHAEFSQSDPPTFVVQSADDPIVNVPVVERRVQAMIKAGIEVEYHKYQNAGHGFGLGTGTEADGWLAEATSFWERQLAALR